MPVPESFVSSLAAMPIFAGLERTTLELIAQGMRVRRFRRGEVIFHIGDPGDALFVVMTGQVKIVLPGETGDEVILTTLGPGEVFGELALLDGAARSASAVALVATQTVVLQREAFRALLDRSPSIRDSLLASLAAEIRRLTDQVEELHVLDVPGRLAACLVRLAAGRGADPDGSVVLPAGLTQGDIAAMVGCTRQSVNKQLGRFALDGLVRVDPNHIVVLDLERLRTAIRR
jgi:CRP/FNR family cyclic AMP-dependent transcriptional regulator